MDYPDPTLRRPLTLAAVLPVLLYYYALAVLAILPNTFIFKIFLLPFVSWQASRCAIRYDCAPLEAQIAGLESTDNPRLSSMNMFFVVRSFSRAVSPGRVAERNLDPNDQHITEVN